MGKVVVITGASAGVGRATARRWARPGVSLALLARGQDGLEAARAEAEAQGARALGLTVDVSDAHALEEAADRVERELGPIDVWVNNAMTTVFSPVLDVEPEEFARVTEVNYLGYIYGTLAALRRMKPRNRGTIVQVGSALAYRSIPLQSAYCGSKAAIRGFTDSLRSELKHDGSKVHVTMVQLPALNTPQFRWTPARLPYEPRPLAPIFQPEVAADAIYFAARSRRREVWVGGMTYKAILGNRVAPGVGDRMLAKEGYEGQQSELPVDPDKPTNLWAPVAGDHGAHGPFEAEAHPSSPLFWWTRNRNRLLLGLATSLLTALGWILSRPRPSLPRPRKAEPRQAAEELGAW